MSQDFIAKINQSYGEGNASIYLGAAVLNNQILSAAKINVPLRMMNRHGLVAGATGTGKTRTLQVLAEQLSNNGVPVFLLDVKGDLSGMAEAGTPNEKITERAKALSITYTPNGFPCEFYSLTGKSGAPMRATVLEFGPVLLAKILELNDTQTGVLQVIFKYADDQQLPLVDFSDLKKVLNYLSEGPGKEEIKADYGKISSATAGTILRKIVAVEQQGLDTIFGETSFDIHDLMSKVDGKGLISLLNISDCQQQPMVYSTFLMSLLVELYHNMPEAGDLDKPKLVFFIDEAHLLFKDSSKDFLEQIEQIIRLIRSKGIGIFFCTQSPTDIPETVLSQLGNRVQHAIRVFTPNDADNLKKTVKTYPKSLFFEIDTALTSMGIGQALVTVLDEKGIPTEVAVTHLTPPQSVMGPATATTVETTIKQSELYAKYEKKVDPESAYEILTDRLNKAEEDQPEVAKYEKPTTKSAPARKGKSTAEKILNNSVTKQVGRSLVRGLFGMLFGKR